MHTRKPVNASVNAWDWTPRFTAALRARARAPAPKLVTHALGCCYDTARRLLDGGKPEADTLAQALLVFKMDFAAEVFGDPTAAKALRASAAMIELAKSIAEDERRLAA